VVKLIAFIRRNPALEVEEFHRHWLEVHGPLVRDTPELARHIIRYEQNHRLASDYERGSPDFDGVAVTWYRSIDDFWAFVSEPAYLEVLHPDELVLLDFEATTFLLTEEEDTIIAGGPQPDLS